MVGELGNTRSDSPVLVPTDTYLLKLELGVKSSCGNADQVADFHGVLADPKQQI